MAPRRARATRASYLAGARVMVDSNVLIDVLEGDPAWFDWSAAQLAPLVDAGALVINPIVYAEIAAAFSAIEELDAAIAPLEMAREALPWQAAFLASQAFKLYRRRGGAKRSPLPDFYIGAHATLAGHTLLTRDPQRYREYFPRLEIVAPQSC